MLFLSHLYGCHIINALMGTMMIIVHLPQTELVLSVLGVDEGHLLKQVLVIGAVGAFNEPILPRLALRNKCMDAPPLLYQLGKSRLIVGVVGIFHGEVHGVVGEGDEKGGRFSNAL